MRYSHVSRLMGRPGETTPGERWKGARISPFHQDAHTPRRGVAGPATSIGAASRERPPRGSQGPRFKPGEARVYQAPILGPADDASRLAASRGPGRLRG